MIGDILIQKSKNLSPRVWRMISENMAEYDGKRYKVHCPYGDKIYIGMGAGSISNWMRNL